MLFTQNVRERLSRVSVPRCSLEFPRAERIRSLTVSILAADVRLACGHLLLRFSDGAHTRENPVNIPRRRSGRLLLLCARLLPTSSSGGILDSTGPAAETLAQSADARETSRIGAGSGLRSESKVLSALLPRPQDRFPFKAPFLYGQSPATQLIRLLLSALLLMPFQDTVSDSCGTLTRGVLLFKQVPLSGANGSFKKWLSVSFPRCRGFRPPRPPDADAAGIRSGSLWASFKARSCFYGYKSYARVAVRAFPIAGSGPRP